MMPAKAAPDADKGANGLRENDYRDERRETRNQPQCREPDSEAKRDMGEITSALQYATAAAQQFHVPFNTALASIAGFSAAGMHGSEAGTAFAEMMNAIGCGAMEKLGITVARAKDGVLDLHGTLANLVVWIHAHPGFDAAEQLTKAFGIRGARAELLVAQLSKLDDA